MTGKCVAAGLLGTFVTWMAPSRTMTTSVKVPPTSTLNRVRPILRGSQRHKRAEQRTGFARHGMQALSAFDDPPPPAFAHDAIAGERRRTALGAIARDCGAWRGNGGGSRAREVVHGVYREVDLAWTGSSTTLIPQPARMIMKRAEPLMQSQHRQPQGRGDEGRQCAGLTEQAGSGGAMLGSCNSRAAARRAPPWRLPCR